MVINPQSDSMFGTVVRGMILALVLGVLLFYFLPPALARFFEQVGWL